MPFNKEVRFFSQHLFVFYDKQKGIGKGATNMKALSDCTGMKYGRIRYLFGDLNKSF